LNEKTGRTNAKWRYRLPSEAQWKYAAKGGPYRMTPAYGLTKYAGGNKLKEVGWYEKTAMTRPNLSA
jgi:formylglycine-generating enzyme required for sulfatase activity